MKLQRLSFGLATVWAISTVSLAQAQEADPLSQFLVCSDIAHAPSRYDCYDSTAAAVKADRATNRPEVMTLGSGSRVPDASPHSPEKAAEKADQPHVTPPAFPQTPSQPQSPVSQPRDDRVEQFGLKNEMFGARTENEFGIRPDPESLDIITTINASIIDFEVSGTGRITVLLDNGQVWRQISGDNTRLSERKMGRQTSAKIETAAFGSFLMTLTPASQAIRVRRIH